MCQSFLVLSFTLHARPLQKIGFKRGDNSNTRWFQEKARHAGSRTPGANAYHANFTSVEDYGCSNDTVELTDAYQAHDNLAGFASGSGEEARDWR